MSKVWPTDRSKCVNAKQYNLCLTFEFFPSLKELKTRDESGMENSRISHFVFMISFPTVFIFKKYKNYHLQLIL
jgi:hypothetical protein